MKCIFDNEVDENQLLAYLDHEANQDTVKHLEQCAYCLERANALARLHDHLTDNLFRVDCPSSLELGEYHLHMLAPAQMLVISKHLRDCPHCKHEIEQLKIFLSDLMPTQENNLADQAKVVIARIVGGMADLRKSGMTLSEQVSYGLRGESKGLITLEANGIVIVLDIQSIDNESVEILGQVAADEQGDWAGALVELYQDKQLESSTTVDDLGAFHFKNILPGEKVLHVSPRSGSIVVVSTFEVSN